MGENTTTSSSDSYIKDRVENQIQYFNRKAIESQKWYRRLKKVAIVCNILTTIAIALVFAVPDRLKLITGSIAFVLSMVVLATYQWEEFANYGSKWEKFRLVTERLKSEKFLYQHQAGRYASDDEKFSKIIKPIADCINKLSVRRR